MLLNLSAITALTALLHGGSGLAQTAPVALKHIFTPGLKSVYHVSATIHTEARQRGLVTFLPSDQDISYGFTTTTLSVSDGIAKMRFERPSITETVTDPETGNLKDVVEKLDSVQILTLTPINEIIDYKELSKPGKSKSGDERIYALGSTRKLAAQLEDFIGPFIEDVQRLSVSIGSPDSSIDLAPRFDLHPVKIGDTWKRTVGFQPQKLKSKSGKTIVQRLDITYIYDGPGTFKGKPSVKVHAILDLKSDLGAYLNDLVGLTSEETKIKTIPLNLKSRLDFDLDPKTLQTFHAVCDSEGGFSIVTTIYPDALVEEKLKGNSILELVSNKMVAPAKPAHKS